MTKEVMNWNNKIGGKKAERIPCPDGIEGCLVGHYKVIEEQTKQEQETPKCKTHPDAPHGFVRNASHSEDRYVCECEFWEPPEQDEPVAYVYGNGDNDPILSWSRWDKSGREGWHETPLYTKEKL